MNNKDDESPPLDLINVIFILLSIGFIASYGWPLLFIAIPLYFGQQALRNAPAFREWRQRIITPVVVGKLLPAPPKTDTTAMINKPAPVYTPTTKIVDPYEHLPFWERVTKTYDTNTTYQPTLLARNKGTIEERQLLLLQRGLKRLPAYLHYKQLPSEIPSRLSVAIGVDSETQNVLWGDFDSDSENARILHAMIAGQTGSGKDSVLRLWFTTLTLNNTPEQVKFVILDGKIDWLTPALAESAYMAIPPAGGIDIQKINGKRVDKAKERMSESLDWVFDEIEQRGILLREVGAINLNTYNAKAKQLNRQQLPMIFLIASDVGEMFDDELGMLVNQLIMKGRAFGIRLIISLQDPVGEKTKWRSQIGLVMSGYQQNPDHDRYIMGIDKARAVIRPSQLPNPEENDIARGLFVVRQGSKQYLVRTAHLPEEDWFTYIESKRFAKHWYTQEERHALLSGLILDQSVPKQLVTIPVNPKEILTKEQIVMIISLAKAGYTKTYIMEKLGFTNGSIWSSKKQAVEQVIVATRGSVK